jgi:hypothetical protein
MKKIVFFALLSAFAFANIYSGKVMAKYTQTRFGKNWLVLNLNKNGRFIQVMVAPTSVMSSIGVKVGDNVTIKGFTPPMWPPMLVKAYEIYDNTQNKDYKIKGGGMLVK